jgi:hypothetical protein
MPNGYYLPYIADSDQPYWHFQFGRSPKPNNAAGTIPKGSVVYLQRPPDTLGTHQSAYLYGVGRILVGMGKFRPAPATNTGS